MKQFFIVMLLVALTVGANAQEYNGLWHSVAAITINEKAKPALNPEHFATFTANESTLKAFLGTSASDPTRAGTIALPTPDGSYRNFRIWQTTMMEAPLAERYRDINTYTAEAVDNRSVTAKIDYTAYGFHAMVFNGENTFLVDPSSGKADGYYIAYYKKDSYRPSGRQMACDVLDEEAVHTNEINASKNGLPVLQDLVFGTIRRTYRLALAADSEYCIAVADSLPPTKANVLSKMVTTMNRVNGVYERELAVTMVLIAKEDTLIFNTTAPDPYDNNSGGSMLDSNQVTLARRIGLANFDIGHVFSTGGGGIAQRGSVCQTTAKAMGVTGAASPVGDAFDIDFVAHEMGHQFGGDHTFNANTGSCAGNGVSNKAFEPGSGTTIMAYAGICGGGNDFQAHSDAYFHSTSLEQISTFLTNGATCATTVLSSNGNATVPAYAASYTIPYKTPFELTAPLATDGTADSITYCWEERDLGDFRSTLPQTHFNGPMFRSFPPTTSQTRVFPNIAKLALNRTTTGEKLPDTARNMSFRFTERDVFQGWGTFNFPDDAISLSVINTGAPFAVTAPIIFDDWTGGTNQRVQWDVSKTNLAPINAATVDIWLSTDGGLTYPVLVKAGTPNDGSEVIVVPNVATTSNARIKVKGSGNVFFNISAGDFTINHSTVGVAATSPVDQVIIAPVPAKDFLKIEVPAALGAMKIQIYNAIGQCVFSDVVRVKAAVAVSTWARGFYQVIVRSDNGSQKLKKIILE